VLPPIPPFENDDDALSTGAVFLISGSWVRGSVDVLLVEEDDCCCSCLTAAGWVVEEEEGPDEEVAAVRASSTAGSSSSAPSFDAREMPVSIEREQKEEGRKRRKGRTEIAVGVAVKVDVVYHVEARSACTMPSLFKEQAHLGRTRA
jgi:hypothetical protein